MVSTRNFHIRIAKKAFFKFSLIPIALFFFTSLAFGQQSDKDWSVRMTQTAMQKWPDVIVKNGKGGPKWSYDMGLLLKGVEGVWEATGQGKYFHYIRHIMDKFVRDDGTIRDYEMDGYKLDDLNNGKILLLLYEVTGKEKYWKAATLLRKQLNSQPRTAEGGFWHKSYYPHQMWLDGLYMEAPFYAHYAELADSTNSFNDVAKQFFLMEKNVRDPQTGLLYHGFDESRDQRWADPVTGRSANFWGRAMGWYGMALVDALDYFPKDHPKHQLLINILQRYAKAVSQVQDPDSGLWYQVLDQPNRKGNYHEASASNMFVYTLAKGVRKGYLDRSYLNVAKKGYQGILDELINVKDDGSLVLKNTNTVAGLGGDPYRDGSYEYYINAERKTNDVKGMGAFILASTEMERINKHPKEQGANILLDHYFNNEYKEIAGHKVPYHYTWHGRDNNGFWFLGDQFRRNGGHTSTLSKRPTKRNLSGADVYLVVDPDTKEETDHLHPIEKQDVNTIVNWVKKGGVLVLMGNDKGNADLGHLNDLASEFGIRFNRDSRNDAHGGHWERGTFNLPKSVPFASDRRKILIQGLSTLEVSSPAEAVFSADNGDKIMAVSHPGKGTVFAVGDPWLYNEYLDGRKDMPEGYQNFEAAGDLAQWLISQAKR